MSNQKKIATIFLILFFLSFIFIPVYHVSAYGENTIFGKLPECFNPEAEPKIECTICDVIGMGVGIAKFILSIVGVLALALFIWGGFGLIISAGNEEKVKKNKGILVGTLVGIIIILVAWQIVWLTVATLMGGTQKNGLTIFGENGYNWSNICKTSTTLNTQPPVVLKAPRGKQCEKTEDCETTPLKLTCVQKYNDSKNICAALGQIKENEKCFPLKDPSSECTVGKCNKTCHNKNK
jgi:hypothetical protein